MAAFGGVKSMDHLTWKPRRLSRLLMDRIPDKASTSLNYSDLLEVVDDIVRNNLLYETEASSMAHKVIDSWKSALDAFLDRVFLLLSSDMAEKCWAGISLLGFYFKECNSNRFLASYRDCFDKLLPHFQSQGGLHLKVASCAAMSALFNRLGKFENVKNDATSIAGKIIELVLKLLKEDSTKDILMQETTVHLLFTIMTFFPFSVRGHCDSAEEVITSTILLGKCSDTTQKKLAHCLASLPKSKGNKDSLSSAMENVLSLICSHILDAFGSLTKADDEFDKVIRLLVLPGKDEKRSPTSSISMLMSCYCEMLTTSYPCQVIVPVGSLLDLTERVLMLDSSFKGTSLMVPIEQDEIRSELPKLHSNFLDLLFAIITSTRRRRSLPHAKHMMRIISAYFIKCAPAETKLRVKVYSIAKLLMKLMGRGMATSLSREVVNNAIADLSLSGDENIVASSTKSKATSTISSLHPKHKKRKHSAEIDGSTSVLEETTENHLKTPVSVRVAALEALEALIEVGSFKSEVGLSKVSHHLLTTATNSLNRRCANEDKETIEILGKYQCVALRALSKYLLSSAHKFPPYLDESLELFHRGKQESGTELANICSSALSNLDQLLLKILYLKDDYADARNEEQNGTDNAEENDLEYDDDRDPLKSLQVEEASFAMFDDGTNQVSEKLSHEKDISTTDKDNSNTLAEKLSGEEYVLMAKEDGSNTLAEKRSGDEEVSMTKEDGDNTLASKIIDISPTTSDSDTDKDEFASFENTSKDMPVDEDGFPDLLDVDPDSDEELV